MKFTVDDKQVRQFLELAPRKTTIAVKRAITRGTRSARTAAARILSKDIGITVAAGRKAVRMELPASKTGALGILLITLRRIKLINLGARGPEPSRGKGRGVSYKAKGGRKRIESGFIATVGGERGVFLRKGIPRKPIRELYGPSPGRVADLHRKQIAGRGFEVASKELDRQLNRIFGIK